MEILRNSCKQEEPKETWQVIVILFPGSDPGTGKEKNLGFFPLGWKLGNLNKVWSYVIDYVCAQSLSYVWLFATPWTVTYQASLPISNFQARVLDWGAISYSRGSSWPRDWTRLSRVIFVCGWILHHWRHLGSPHRLHMDMGYYFWQTYHSCAMCLW